MKPEYGDYVSPLTGDRLTAGEATLFNDSYTTTPIEGIYCADCYICRDPDFARMGLPLCRRCPFCRGHVAADDSICSDCGKDEMDALLR